MKGYAATSWAPKRLDLFYLQADSSMFHYAADPTPSAVSPDSSVLTTLAFEELGGTFTSVPAAVTWLGELSIIEVEPGASVEGALSRRRLPTEKVPRIDVFALGANYEMRHLALWNGQSPSRHPQWSNLGGIFISSPAAVAWGGRVDVFGVGLDRAMYSKTLRGDVWSSGWWRHGGIFTSHASAVSWGPDRLDLFARGSDFTLRHKSFEIAYKGSHQILKTSDWQNLGGALASAPVAVSWGPNRLDVFANINDPAVPGRKGMLGHRWWDGSIWNDWEYFGLPEPDRSFVSTPEAVAWGPGRLDVFVSGSDGNVYHLWLTGDQFQGPESLGSITTPPVYPAYTPSPRAISVAPDRLDLFAPNNRVNQYGHDLIPTMGHRSWDGTHWLPWSGTNEFALPSRYRFSVDEFTVKRARSLNQDTDIVQSSLSVSNWPTQALSKYMGNWGGTAPKQAPVYYVEFGPSAVELCETAVFNYQIVNSADADKDELDASLNKAGTELAKEAIESIKRQLGAGVATITGIEVGFITSVPVIGSILGLLAGWLTDQIIQILRSGRCDGAVALEQAVISGRDLHLNTTPHAFMKTTLHEGTDSPRGCGPNSRYEVMWSIKRV